MSSRGSPDLRLPLLATPRDSDPFHQARTGSGETRDNDSTVGAAGEDPLLQDGSAHAPWTPNDSPRSTQARGSRSAAGPNANTLTVLTPTSQKVPRMWACCDWLCVTRWSEGRVLQGCCC